jgi:CubicO group peptidase (beta-lactamase class C family)
MNKLSGILNSMFSTIIYLARCLLWNLPDVNHYKKFPSIIIRNGEDPFMFRPDPVLCHDTEMKIKTVEYSNRDQTLSSGLDELLKSTGTNAFIIVKDDTIVSEKYFNNNKRESVCTSFSLSKSFTSALIGCAIDEGAIGGIDDYVLKYIPELKDNGFEELKIRHLLSMSSGIAYNEKRFPWADEPKSYYHPDVENIVLKVKPGCRPGSYFKYTNYNTILLGIIIVRATGRAVADYLSEKIWIPLGMEFPATWSVPDAGRLLPKMESGINARPIDYAKFGRLFLNRGQWNGNQVLSSDWIEKSVSPLENVGSDYYIHENFYPYTMLFRDRNLYYKHGWWGLKRSDGTYDYTGIGILGQFIYVCPSRRIVIVRNGSRWGNITWWPALFKSIAEKI